ncbi:MAG TPA: hypothetical protein GX525_07745 [Bacilli bacterium]|nr:hypothetical protein [Bacilli bacterium]
MGKVLFLGQAEKEQLVQEINSQLKIKNNLLRVLFENNEHKLSRPEYRKLVNKYEEQIYLLERARRLAEEAKSREQINQLNKLIEFYHTLDT